MKDNRTSIVDRDAKVDARIPESVKRELINIATVRDIQLSDLLREAIREKIQRFRQQAANPLAV